MTNGREVVIQQRSHRHWRHGGGLKDFPPRAGCHVVRRPWRAWVDPRKWATWCSAMIHGEAKDMYRSRVGGVNGGLPHETSALTLTRLCGSGFQAIVSAAQTILLGDADCALAGGAESMSRGGYLLPTLRWGQRMNNGNTVDIMVGALTDPFDTMHMGVTAENVAAKWGITRERQDQFAVESHRRAINAIQKGYFKSQIIPIEIKSRKGTVLFDTDEHPRADASAEGMAKLKAVFQKDGSVTAGNASGINDGASALVLMERKTAEKRGLKPMARLVAYGHSGVDPKYMGIGPVPAVQRLWPGQGSSSEHGCDRVQQAFAAQACAVAKDLNFDPAKTNPNGGAVALGHPIGATGAILMVKAMYELHRTGARYGLITMCIGGGQGIAGIIERM